MSSGTLLLPRRPPATVGPRTSRPPGGPDPGAAADLGAPGPVLDPPFVVRRALYVRTLLRAGRFVLRYPWTLPLVLAHRWDALEPVKQRMSRDYVRRASSEGRGREFGFRILLDREDAAFVSPSIDLFGWHEIATTMIFDQLLRPGSTVVDVGAGIGWFTLLAARRVGPSGRVVALEPEPASRDLLRRSVELNGFGNVHALGCAAWSDLGRAELHLNDGPNRGAHSMKRQFGGPTIVVPTARLDDVLDAAGIGGVDLLKVDTEGAEPEVLEGAREALDARRIAAVVLEWNPEAWVADSGLMKRLLREFRAYRYDGNVPFRRLERCSDLRRVPRGCLLLLRRSG